MKQTILLVTSIFILSINGLAQQTNHTITVGLDTREYIQYLPVGFNAATDELPIVFVLHGIGGTALSMTVAEMNLIADTARFIVVYPQGANNGFGQPSWNNGTAVLSSTVNDEAFFNKMMDYYITDFNVDISRIYVTGISMGSIMSHHLACKLNHRIAAIGAMSGPMATVDIDYYTTNPLTYKTPVIHLHGTADGTVPYNTNALPSLSLVPQTMAFWINQHGCSATSDSIRKPDTVNDSITVDQFIYNSCDVDGAVELWRFNNAGHTYLYEPVNDITEGVEVWLFLSKWQHPNASPVGISENSIANVRVYPNPSNGEITIDNSSNSDIYFYSIDGSFAGKFRSDELGKVNACSLQSGTYLIQSESLKKPVRVIIQ